MLQVDIKQIRTVQIRGMDFHLLNQRHDHVIDIASDITFNPLPLFFHAIDNFSHRAIFIVQHDFDLMEI